jgi:hypothetical protein
LQQVTVRKAGQAIGGSPAALLSGSNELEKNFTLKEAGEAEGLNWVEATPKVSDSGFERVRLGFSGSDLKAMELLDSFGQTTLIHFSRLERNPRCQRPPSGSCRRPVWTWSANSDRPVATGKQAPAESAQRFGNPLAQRWQDFRFEPRIPAQPQVVARAGVGQRQHGRPVPAPVADRGGQVPRFIRQMVGLCVLADDQRQFDLAEFGQQALPPGRRAFRPGRQVARLAGAGKQKPIGRMAMRSGS